MENRDAYDVYAIATPRGKERIIRTILASSTMQDRASALKAFVRAASEGTYIQVAHHVTWAQATALRDELRAAGDALWTGQSGYGPSLQNRMSRCVTHDVFYAGVLGCPACETSTGD